MLNINIVCIGKIKENYLKDAINEYSKRLRKYCKLNILELPDEKIPDKLNESISQEIKAKESNNILNHIKKDSYIICLDLGYFSAYNKASTNCPYDLPPPAAPPNNVSSALLFIKLFCFFVI